MRLNFKNWEPKKYDPYYLIGKDILNNQQIYQKIKADGHTIGNHTNSHLNGWKTCSKKYIQDIEKCQELMKENVLFRPPYGKMTNKQILNLKTFRKNPTMVVFIVQGISRTSK